MPSGSVICCVPQKTLGVPSVSMVMRRKSVHRQAIGALGGGLGEGDGGRAAAAGGGGEGGAGGGEVLQTRRPTLESQTPGCAPMATQQCSVPPPQLPGTVSSAHMSGRLDGQRFSVMPRAEPRSLHACIVSRSCELARGALQQLLQGVFAFLTVS